jgi:putative heme transporter
MATLTDPPSRAPHLAPALPPPALPPPALAARSAAAPPLTSVPHLPQPRAASRKRRGLLAGSLSLLIVVGVFGLTFPRISSYAQQWRTITALTWPGVLLVTIAAAGSLAATWVMIRAFLPQLRLHQAAAVNLGSSAVANIVPAGGAVALGLTWRMLASWGTGTQDFVRYTLVSGLWNVFARLGLPVIALLAVAISGRPGMVPAVAAYCGAGALLMAAAGFRVLLRSERTALLAGRFLQRAERLGCRLARHPPSQRMADGVLKFRAGTSTLLAERGIRITVTTTLASIAPWLVLLACLRASGLTQGQVPWQASLAVFAMVRLVTVLPVTPGGLGITELGLTAPLAAGLGAGAAARIAAAVLLFRAVTYLPSIPLGALAYLWWRHPTTNQRLHVLETGGTTSAARCQPAEPAPVQQLALSRYGCGQECNRCGSAVTARFRALANGRLARRAEDPPEGGGGFGYCRGMREGVAGEHSHEGARSGLQGHGIAVLAGAGHRAQGRGEPAAGVGVTPCVAVSEQGGHGFAEITGVPGDPGLPGRLASPSQGHSGRLGTHGDRACPAVLGATRADHGCVDSGGNREVPVKSGDMQYPVGLGRDCGQAQEPV